MRYRDGVSQIDTAFQAGSVLDLFAGGILTAFLHLIRSLLSYIRMMKYVVLIGWLPECVKQ